MDEKISNLSQIAYVRRYEFTDGTEKGIKAVEVNNGSLRFILNENKALDMMQLWHNGVNLSFISKNGFSPRKLPFLNGFEGGMIYTVGLESAGVREGFEPHGSIHHTPAKIIETFCDENTIRVTAEIEDTELFGRNLLLRRSFSTAVNGDCVTLTDTLINRGEREENYCILYHINLGYPFLSDDTEILSDAKNGLTPSLFRTYADSKEKQCFYLENELSHIEVKGKALQKTFILDYSKDTLPRFTHYCADKNDDAILGLEPCSNYLDERFTYNKLEPKEEITFTIKLSVK